MTHETLEGTVKTITFYNEETGYSILKIVPEAPVPGIRADVVAVTGVMPELQQGEYVRLEGEWVQNPKYGKQFKASQVMRVLPLTAEGMQRYLGSGLVKNVGEKTAEKIVKRFGAKTFEILDSPNAAAQLRRVRDVGAMRAEAIVEAWREQRDIADVMIYLQQYRIGTALSLKIYRFYKEQDLNPIQIIQSDPYQLSRDIHGVGFKTADRIAQNLGLPSQSTARLQAGILYHLEEAINDGHVYIPAPELLAGAGELLGIDNSALMEEALRQLVAAGELHTDDLAQDDGSFVEAVYKPPLFFSEKGVARRILELLVEPQTRLKSFAKLGEDAWQQLFQRLAQGMVALTAQQQGAVRMALTHKFSIMTGGPGTGKTTTLRTLITALEAHRHSYLLASPTGRAAKRLSQATERSASTIHRMLGASFAGFSVNEENPLDADFIIIDEASMLDIHLFYSLLKALDSKSHLLLVGDVDQLPSVGAGNVLRDLIDCAVLPVTRLDRIFRQAADSLIIENAHRINQGRLPDLENRSTDFFFFGAEEPEQAASLLVDVVQNRIPRKFGVHPIVDIQVLAPMYRTAIGVNTLNIALQAALNPPGKQAEKRIGGEIFRVGDKVMQTRNNYDKNVFNGDIGRVHSIDFQKHLITIMVDDSPIEYDWAEMDQVTLAYACSVHRSQGSEYPIVVIPVMPQHYMLLQRNLLYTAVTRARQAVVLVGMRKAVAMAVNNDRTTERWTALRQRLQQ